MMYKAIAEGLNKRILVPENEVMTKLVELYGEKPNKDFYVSVFKYSEKHKEQFNKTGSLAGINDNKATQIIFDFDDESNIENARKDAIVVFDRLVSNGFSPSDIIPAYSGGKGFHLEINTTNEFQREELVNIRQSLSGDLNTTDPVIKDNQRIIRAVLSKHNKTGLYKIPLTANELKTMPLDKIQAEAKNPSDERYTMAGEVFSKTTSTPASIMKLTKVKPKEVAVKASDEVIDFAKNKTGLTNAKYVLAQGYFEEGERHEAVMILASTYMSLGWPQDLCYNNLKATLRLRNARLGKSVMSEFDKAELWNEVESVYSPLWKGGVYSESSNELLIKTKKMYNIDERFDENPVISISDLKEATEKFLVNLKDNRIYTGLESLDKNLILTKGMLFGVLGSPGSGKTSFLNVFMENTSKNHGPCLYFSMDMSKDLLGVKIMQRYTGYPIEKLEDMILHKTFDKKYINAVARFTEDYKNVGFCFENGYDVSKIDDEIKKYEDKVGSRISLIGVDYLEKVQGPYSEETANSGFVASNLANLAKKRDTCIGLLLQPNKLAGSPADEFKSYRSIKGASKIEQDARAIVGIWRPGYSPEDFMRDRYMSIAILKQNMGKLGRFDYMFDGLTGGITEMTDEQRRLFHQFLEELKNQKEADADL